MIDMLEIGEVAKRTGLRPSAVRYYEQCGLIAPTRGSGGRRAFTEETVERLALILHAKRLGFTLVEIRSLFSGFPDSATAGERWERLATAKLTQIDALSKQLETMRAGLQSIAKCRCRDLTRCAHAIAEKRCAE